MSELINVKQKLNVVNILALVLLFIMCITLIVVASRINSQEITVQEQDQTGVKVEYRVEYDIASIKVDGISCYRLIVYKDGTFQAFASTTTNNKTKRIYFGYISTAEIIVEYRVYDE